MKYSQSTLDKITDIITETGYIIRFERGSFQSGWCILEDKKIVVLNKFLDTEGKINMLLELLPQLDINIDKLTFKTQSFFDSLKKEAKFVSTDR